MKRTFRALLSSTAFAEESKHVATQIDEALRNAFNASEKTNSKFLDALRNSSKSNTKIKNKDD